jgi:hypothetical protein
MRLLGLAGLALSSALIGSCRASEVCAGFGLIRVLPSDTTISVGQSFLAVLQLGGGCAGQTVTDANYHTAATAWFSMDSLVVTVDSLSGRVTGRAKGDAVLVATEWGGPATTVHVR